MGEGFENKNFIAIKLYMTKTMVTLKNQESSSKARKSSLKFHQIQVGNRDFSLAAVQSVKLRITPHESLSSPPLPTPTS